MVEARMRQFENELHSQTVVATSHFGSSAHVLLTHDMIMVAVGISACLCAVAHTHTHTHTHTAVSRGILEHRGHLGVCVCVCVCVCV